MILSVFLIGIIVGFFIAAKRIRKKLVKQIQINKKKDIHYRLMLQWLCVKQDGKSLSDFLIEKGYTNIAIYGMSVIADRLLTELKGSKIHVKYIIDKNAKNIFSHINIISPDEEYAPVDAVIVTPVQEFESIEEKLSKNLSCPILALDDLLFEL